MIRCSQCDKLIFSSTKMYHKTNGKTYCTECNHYFNISDSLLKIFSKDILENFIKKYGIHPSQKELVMLHGLIEKKQYYKININDLAKTLPWILQRLNEEKELSRFEIDLKYLNEKNFYCSVCKTPISKKEFDFSIDRFEKALCFQHQKEEKSTIHAKRLFNALQNRGIKCQLEANDGHKSVDIAIPQAKMYIEIDGSHHSTDASQLKSDIERDYHSYQNGYVTKRFTNNQIKEKLEEIADALVNVARERMKQFENK